MKRSITHLAKKLLPQDVRFALRRLNWSARYLVASLNNKNTEPVYCPLAEKSFKTFIPLPPHLLSPENGARNRQRLVWLYLKNETEIFKKPLRLLHVAPELPYMEKFRLQNNLDYVPGDKMVEGYNNQSGILNIDLTSLKFADNSFDYIVCNHVMEHIPEDFNAISEMYRVLKPGGTAIITTPIDENLKQTNEDPTVITPEQREKHFGQWDHVRYYGTDIKGRFEKPGFTVNLVRYGETFNAEDYRKFGLCKDIILVAQKN